MNILRLSTGKEVVLIGHLDDVRGIRVIPHHQDLLIDSKYHYIFKGELYELPVQLYDVRHDEYTNFIEDSSLALQGDGPRSLGTTCDVDTPILGYATSITELESILDRF